MARCSAGPGRCKIACDGGCGCVYLHEADACICECFDTDDATTGLNVGMGTLVSVSVNGLELGELATRLDRLLTRDVLVPASRARQKVQIKLKRVRFSEAI